jgi:hypothetical protein
MLLGIISRPNGFFSKYVNWLEWVFLAT